MEEPQPTHEQYHCLFSTKVLITYIYLTKSIAMSIIYTMPYVYPHLPSYSTLSLFAAVTLPLSFKFIFAPLEERYSLPAKGKRRLWVIASLIVVGIMICISSRWTALQEAHVFIALMMVSQLGCVMLEIALDSLAIKEIKSPQNTTTIQFVSVMIGSLIGSLTLLKLTSMQFAQKFDMPHPVTSPAVIILIFGILLLLPVPYLIFYFTQTVLPSQLTATSTPLCTVISHYKYFFDLSTKYCRMSIFFVFVTQGTLFFAAGYNFQLVKAGFSKDDLNTIHNLIHLPICLLLSKMTDITDGVGKLSSWLSLIIILILVDMLRLVFFPLGFWVVAMFIFLNMLFYSWKIMLRQLMINELPVHAYSGMFLTMANSFNNMGQNHMLHIKLIGIFGFKVCAWIGLAFQVIIIFFIPRILQWIDEGHITVELDIIEEDGRFIEIEVISNQNKNTGALQNPQKLKTAHVV